MPLSRIQVDDLSLFIVYRKGVTTAQVPLEDWAWAALQSVASEKGIPVSELIRSAVEEKYLQGPRSRVEAFRAWKAPWRDRGDIRDAAEYVRELREDGRIDRLYSE